MCQSIRIVPGGLRPVVSQAPNQRFIHSHVRARQYRVTSHATIMRLARGIQMRDIEQVLLTGEIIEQNPDATPYPTSLILGWLPTGDPLHVVCSRGDIEPALRIVTVYEPDDDAWMSDYKTRKVRK